MENNAPINLKTILERILQVSIKMWLASRDIHVFI